MNRFARKKRTAADKRVALLSMLAMRRSLDDIDLGSACRSYGLPQPEVEKMIAAEQARRAAR